jgi:hypothetical protein
VVQNQADKRKKYQPRSAYAETTAAAVQGGCFELKNNPPNKLMKQNQLLNPKLYLGENSKQQTTNDFNKN